MWDSVVAKVWKDVGGNREDVVFAEKSGRYKTGVEERIERSAGLTPRSKAKSKKILVRYTGG